ncbi:urease subunit beta [Paenibacillus pasadenensis]|uniref:urease subunit beta n=1 Tax=Paenibacillus pasadenensis TaxID=217090 RepID=UPI00203E97CC|nr:urease subunit beta [Paenibacillus pasadenensis]MCM3746623.1 urease subunit beta [Paenibacillus pasadenensis]
MIPGEFRTVKGSLTLNEGRRTQELLVANIGDRPIQVGSHFHFFEVNRGLRFNREQAFGMRLNIPAGTAVRFEPGEEKPVELVELGGSKLGYGLSGITNGPAQAGAMPDKVRERLADWEGSSS